MPSNVLVRIGIGLLLAVVGYVVVAIAAYFLDMWLSTNVRDKQMEAAMMAAFFFGPAGAVLGFILGLFLPGWRRSP